MVTKKDRYLIINADDFGYNTQQTEAINELFLSGLITSTSLMAVAPDAENAAKSALKNAFPVGVHLTINSDDSENRWQSISGGTSLSDEKGLFYKQSRLALHARRIEVLSELEAQFLYISDKGVSVDHADNHCATLYGINGRRFYIEAYEFCASHNLPYRFPKTPGFLERQLERKVPKPLVAFQKRIVEAGVKRGVRLLDDLVSNPWSMSRIGNYETLRDYYIRAVDECVEGVTEMFLHPAYPLGDGQSEWTKRVYEYRLLKSGDLLERAKQNGIQVVGWSIFNSI